MKTIIAGSRGISKEQFESAISLMSWVPTKVISGGARGVDKLGEEWAASKGIPIQVFYPKWNRHDGTIDRGAGMKRNVEMAKNAEALFAIWDGKSPGTQHMIQTAKKNGLVFQVEIVNQVTDEMFEK